MNKLSAFLHVYFFQIEGILNANTSKLSSVQFHSEEANTDLQLKLFFKEFLIEHNSIVKNNVMGVLINQFKEVVQYEHTDIEMFIVKQVLLPEELSLEHKNVIQQQKHSVYTNPDLFLCITNTKTKEDHYISLELKSTKENKIPGSSIQQINPYEWVVFVRHKNNQFKIVTGIYVNSITNRLSFPDRSPRPEIGLNTLDEWNRKNRVLNNNYLSYNYEDGEIGKKLLILQDWHKVLVAEWMSVLMRDCTDKKEKWFNHTIRLFSIELLSYYNSLENEQQLRFKDLNSTCKCN